MPHINLQQKEFAAMNSTMDWLTLFYCQSLTNQQKFTLYKFFPNLRELFQNPKELLKDVGLPSKVLSELAQSHANKIDTDMKWLQQPSHHIITWEDERYPDLLKQISCPPLLIYVMGDPQLLSQAQLGIVGSRKPSPGGIEIATEFSKQLSKAGLIITSGLALGIDAIAHLGAIAEQKPTIAVLGTGVNVIYPRQNLKTFDKILENGAIISEFPLNSPARRQHFPQRNRIISGLSLGVLVIEATLKSGTMITARLANEQGRDVFAIPGSIFNLNYQGCHELIKQGAKLVEKIDDILSELNYKSPKPTEEHLKQLKFKENKKNPILAVMSDVSMSINNIVENSGLTLSEVSAMILQLELAGHIIATPGGYVKTGK